MHPEDSIGPQNGESVVDNGTEFGVNVLGNVLAITGSVPGPVDEITDNILLRLWGEGGIIRGIIVLSVDDSSDFCVYREP